MENQATDTAASSPAPQQTFDIPSDPAANLEWRKTGEIPAAKEAKTPKEESAPSKTASAAASKDAAETDAASATAPKQEKAKSDSAATRLNELLADLKRAGLSPAELKTYKREAQAAQATDTPAKPETTANPQGEKREAAAPVKPTMRDKNPDGTDKYKTWEELDEAKDKWLEEMADFKASQAVAKDRQERAQEAQQQVLKQKLTDAKARYGDETEATVGSAVRAVLTDEGISVVVKQLLNESPVLIDVMYTLGSNAEDLASFVELAKSNPGAAIRKVALLEQLVEQELTKGKGAASAQTDDTPRDETGKFAKPAKEKPAGPPPPPEELNTRGSAPPDALEAAVKAGDFAAFKAEEDRRDLRRRRGA